MADWWYLTAGEPTGPVSDSALVAMALNGGLSPSSAVYRGGDADWTPLGAHEQALGLPRNTWNTYFVDQRAQRGPEDGGVLSQPAKVGPRLLAFVLDYWRSVLTGTAALLVALPLWAGGATPATGVRYLVANLAAGATTFLYEVISTAVRGQTKGKLRTDIEVVVTDSAAMPTLGRAGARALIKSVSLAGPWSLLCLVVWLVTPNRFTVHDWLAGTTVQEATY